LIKGNINLPQKEALFCGNPFHPPQRGGAVMRKPLQTSPKGRHCYAETPPNLPKGEALLCGRGDAASIYPNVVVRKG